MYLPNFHAIWGTYCCSDRLIGSRLRPFAPKRGKMNDGPRFLRQKEWVQEQRWGTSWNWWSYHNYLLLTLSASRDNKGMSLTSHALTLCVCVCVCALTFWIVHQDSKSTYQWKEERLIWTFFQSKEHKDSLWNSPNLLSVWSLF